MADDGAGAPFEGEAALGDQLSAMLTFRWSALPTITPDLPGAGGQIRAAPEDFSVEELALYEPSGGGSHAYAWVEKVGLTTRDLLRELQRVGVPLANIGVAGLKDKVALTRQWLSVPRRFEELAWGALDALEGVSVLRASRHRNKLGMGHLRGNAFRIRVRGVDPEALPRIEAVLARLAQLGLPNYFGPQRFGRFGRNAIDGYQVLQGGRVSGDRRLQRFLVSALQSQLFNAMLAERIELGLFRAVLGGDWARKHDTGGTFEVSDAALERLRAEQGAISATLPLYGKKVRVAAAEAGVLEERMLERFGLSWVKFRGRHGDRRISRLLLLNARAQADSDGVVLEFELPKGSYATVLLRELLKVDVDAPLDGPAIEG